ncbi:MAG: heptaprenylglyceryl phosphate synthase [Clostridiales bacterium]|nr:heptaprenylglyceryl phosphate synthase [Clostridiales bacterium]
MWNTVNWDHWRIVLKLDPDKDLSRKALDIIVKNRPDAVIVGGTQRIDFKNTKKLVESIRMAGYNGSIVQEISTPAAIVDNVDAHFIPVVLNAGHYCWITGMHQAAIKKYQSYINWNNIVTEGYLICNVESAAGRLTEALPVDIEDAAAYVLLAEQLLGLSMFYIEYSGSIGDENLINKIKKETKKIHLVYGGGIKSSRQAGKFLKMVDTIVVGNVIYENPDVLPDILSRRYYNN